MLKWGEILKCLSEKGNEYFELVFDLIEDAVQIVDCTGINFYYNRAAEEMDGLKRWDVLGKHILQVYPSLTLETSSLLQVLVTEKPVLNKQQSIVSSSGKAMTIIYNTYPLYRDGILIGACDISRDITKIKELSERVMELQAELVDSKHKRRHKNQHGSLARYTFNDIIGNHESIINLKVLAQRIAANSSSILVYGETGTGKELVVQSIHNASPRKDGPFIPQNCAAFPVTLLESILFGTVKGSFTGAEDRPGLFELAHGGTLFLDEINSMPMELQSKLLRVLQEGVVRRVGDTKTRSVDTRVIACTNVDPEKAVQNNEIRIDLYYRLNVVSLKIPPLRERKMDIPSIISHYIKSYNQKLGCRVHKLSKEVNELFLNYSWPGNVRELQHAIEHAANIVTGAVIGLEHLPDYLRQEANKNCLDQISHLASTGNLPDIISSVEKRCIRQAMEKCNFNISQAALLLGIPRQTLQYKLKNGEKQEKICSKIGSTNAEK